MTGLLRGELILTADIIAGLVMAEIIMRLHVPDLVMRHLLPKNIPAVTGLAVAVSAGSSKAGAAIISSALSRGEISEHCAVWSVLMLPLPSYLRRWPSTFLLSVSMAGLAGGIFAVSLLLRSVLRFVIAFLMVRREGIVSSSAGIESSKYSANLARKLVKTLPVAWVFYACAYALVPVVDGLLTENFAGKLLPLSGWAVSAASIGHVSAALSLAGGALAAGTLTVTQAIFALILGSGFGTATRLLRQNAGYYYGLFPRGIATRMLAMNFATIIPLVMMNLLFAGLALSLWP